MTDFPTLPYGKFDVIYADPPWSYTRRMAKAGGEAASIPDEHYPTVPLKDLKVLDIPSIAADNCMLFMWATSPLLKEAMELGEAWGFKYSTIGFVWDKVLPCFGAYTHSRCEIVLIFKRGNRPTPQTFNEHQFLSEVKGAHSVKPDEIRQRIEKMFPEAKRIELFARERYQRWNVWGLECDGNRVVERRKGGPRELPEL